LNGTVKFYNINKNFGFITGEDGKDYFVHGSGIADNEQLRDAMPVSFDVIEDEKGQKAINVRKA
jgi:CspA family cold shock protein